MSSLQIEIGVNLCLPGKSPSDLYEKDEEVVSQTVKEAMRQLVESSYAELCEELARQYTELRKMERKFEKDKQLHGT
jgi:hypothetical protein